MEDITLDRLFRATKQVDIAGRTLTVRALTDVERNFAFRSANLARARLARKLDVPDSDEALAQFGNVEELSDQDLRQVIHIYQQREAVREAQNRIKLVFVPFPDDATPEETDAVIKQREDNQKKMDADRDKFITEWLLAVDKRLADSSREGMLAEYRKAIRDTVILSEYSEELEVQILKYALDGQMSELDIKGMASQVRRKLMSSVSEVNNIDPLVLKSPVSTASSPEAQG